MTIITALRCLFVLVFAITPLNGQVGNSCRVRYTGAAGVCRWTKDCLQVKKQAEIGIQPTYCGYHHNTPIVCCESTIEANENSFLNIDPPNTSGGQMHFPDSFVYPDENIRPTNIVEKKCEEYSRPLNDFVQILPLVAHGVPTSVNITKCDYAGVPLIVGGTPAQDGEFPHMAAVGFRDADDIVHWNCGGTLISERYVVSAAHCASSRDGPPVKIRLGVTNLEKYPQTLQDFDIEKIIKHPRYNRSQKYDDIVLFKLERNVKFTSAVRPACLWTKHSLKSSTAIATGWGRIEFGGDTSEKLLKVTLQTYDNQLCANTYKAGTKGLPRGVTSTMLCAGDLRGGKDTCSGDSGGPLQITKDNNQCIFYLMGVTSFGRNCAAPNTPAIYTRVSSYIDWITETIW